MYMQCAKLSPAEHFALKVVGERSLANEYIQTIGYRMIRQFRHYKIAEIKTYIYLCS